MPENDRTIINPTVLDLFFDSLSDIVASFAEFPQSMLNVENFLNHLKIRIALGIERVEGIENHEEIEKEVLAIVDVFSDFAMRYYDHRTTREAERPIFDVFQDRSGQVSLTLYPLRQDPMEINMDHQTARQLSRSLLPPNADINVYGGILRVVHSRLEIWFRPFGEETDTVQILLPENRYQELIEALLCPRRIRNE